MEVLNQENIEKILDMKKKQKNNSQTEDEKITWLEDNEWENLYTRLNNLEKKYETFHKKLEEIVLQ
jgi:hypothetical protein